MNRSRLLIRLSSLNAIGFYILTPFIIGLSLLEGYGGPNISTSVICLLLLNLGYAISSILPSEKTSFVKKLLAQTLVPALPAVTAVFLLPGIALKAYVLVFTAVFYFTGYRAAKASDYSILTDKRIFIGIILCAASLILSLHIPELGKLFPTIAVLSSLFAIICLIVLNQRTLDYNIYVKRGVDASGVQKKLRSYNLRTVVLLPLIIAVLFNIKEIVIKLYAFAAFLTGKAFYYIFLAMSYIFPESREGNGGALNGQDILPLPEEGGRSIFATILNIIVVVLFALAVIKLLPRMVRALVGKLKSLWGRLVRFLKAFFSKKETGMKIEFEEFVDRIEIVRQRPDTHQKKAKSRVYLRNLKSVKDPIMRIRQIYRTIIEYYRDTLEITKSNTAGEILKKSERLGTPYFKLRKITNEYEKARYGGIPPTDDFLSESEAFVRQSLK